MSLGCHVLINYQLLLTLQCHFSYHFKVKGIKCCTWATQYVPNFRSLSTFWPRPDKSGWVLLRMRGVSDWVEVFSVGVVGGGPS